MIRLRRLPIRLRLTFAFAAVMAVLLAGLAMFVYMSISTTLLDEIETGLRSHAATIEAALPGPLDLATKPNVLVERRESFAQLIALDGRLIESTPGIQGPLLSKDVVKHLTQPRYFEVKTAGVQNVARLLAVPENGRAAGFVLVVGASMSDRGDALRLLTILFAIGGPGALSLSSLAGWFVAGRALHPVERMRRQASAITSSGADRRLTLPEADDEVRRLADTLNGMLQRLDESWQTERRFLDHASHELRTPLTALKAELDLALTRPRTVDDLTRALASASEETDRLARLADDLLLLSRLRAGRLPIHRELVSMRALLDSSAKIFGARAAATGVLIAVEAPDAVIGVDQARVRQAIDNLVDNSFRFARGTIQIRGQARDGSVSLSVEDDGPGFKRPLQQDVGLGLAIARAVAESHGGAISIENKPEGGARVTLELSGATDLTAL